MRSRTNILCALSVMLIVSAMQSLPVNAQDASAAAPAAQASHELPINLDLSSTTASMTAPSQVANTPVNINIVGAPLPKIATRNTQKIEMQDGVSAFVSEFSIASALTNVVPLKKLLASETPAEKQLVHSLLKNYVLLRNFTPTEGPYKSQ